MINRASAQVFLRACKNKPKDVLKPSGETRVSRDAETLLAVTCTLLISSQKNERITQSGQCTTQADPRQQVSSSLENFSGM